MKFLKEAFGESEELDTFVLQSSRRFSSYYVVELRIHGKVSTRNFAYEDAATEYYEKLKNDMNNDTSYYDGAEAELYKVNITKTTETIDEVTIYNDEE